MQRVKTEAERFAARYRRYRVSPPAGIPPMIAARFRGRAFDYLERAIEYATEMSIAIGHGAPPISIVRGSGSDFEIVGEVGPYGWVSR